MTAPKRPDPAVWETPVMRKALAAHDFATVFTALVHDYGYTQVRLAALIGTQQPRISEYATAYRPVTDIAVLRRIVAGLGIPPGYVGLACCPCPHYDDDRPEGT